MNKLLMVMLTTIIALVVLVSCSLFEGGIDGQEAEETSLEEALPEDSGEAAIGMEEPRELEGPRRSLRQGEESFDLVGGWLWMNGPSIYVYFFEEDGSGARGFMCDGLNPDFVPDWEEFEWVMSDGELTLETGGVNIGRWSIAIFNDILTLTSEQVAGLEYTYVRMLEPEGNEHRYDELLGVWMWEGDNSWFYEFELFSYGVGSRPAFPTGRETFNWLITADRGLLIYVEDGLVEMWSYAIEGDILILTSRQVTGLEYRYILDDDRERML